MTTDQRKAILETYGSVEINPYITEFTTVYLFDKNGFRFCKGVGISLNEAIERLYILSSCNVLLEVKLVGSI